MKSAVLPRQTLATQPAQRLDVKAGELPVMKLRVILQTNHWTKQIQYQTNQKKDALDLAKTHKKRRFQKGSTLWKFTTLIPKFQTKAIGHGLLHLNRRQGKHGTHRPEGALEGRPSRRLHHGLLQLRLQAIPPMPQSVWQDVSMQ